MGNNMGINIGNKMLAETYYCIPISISYQFWDRPQEVIGFWDLWGPSGTSGDHLGTIWEMDSMKLLVSLRIRSFRSARIDPSRRAIAEGYICVKTNPWKQIKYAKRVEKRSKTTKNRHSIKIPYRNITHSYPLQGVALFSKAIQSENRLERL